MKAYINNLMFGGNRELAIARDGYKCVKCGMTRDEHRERFRRDLTVDHIDGRGINKSREEKNNDLSNLQTLCCPCHGSKDGGRASHPPVRKSHCAQGHPFSGANLIMGKNQRTCRTCNNASAKRSMRKYRERLAAL